MRSLVKLLLTISIIWMLAGCTKTDQKEVVIYTSVDQIFSEPILSDFEKNTGIKIKAVYDVEASKTVGLVNRLLAEKGHPRCDVFWNSEVGRSTQNLFI
jgi:iron(III) transport system substrate-binding protein